MKIWGALWFLVLTLVCLGIATAKAAGTWALIVYATMVSGELQTFHYYRTFETQVLCESQRPVAAEEFQEYADEEGLKVASFKLRCEDRDDEVAVFEEMNRQGGLLKVMCDHLAELCRKLGIVIR